MGIDRLASWATIIVTVLALPSYFALFNDWGRKVMEDHKIIAYLLLAAILLVCFAGIASQFGWFKSNDLERITNRTYQNQVVDIDDKSLEDCTFVNVTFRYHGGKFSILRAHISGTSRFETTDLGATGAVNLLQLLQFLEPNFSTSWRHMSAEDFK
jgi:hypothetical protein